MKKSIIYITFVCLFAVMMPLQAQHTQQIVDGFIQHPHIQNANVSLQIYNLRTGEIMAEHRAKNVIPPASTMKLITSASAIELLGPDFRFSTYLETDGTLVDGVLRGNVYIRGTGDPSLGSQRVGDRNFLYKWARALRQQGIHHIQGKVIADVSYFDADAINPQWIWEDMGNYYAPGIFALSYLDNTMNVQLRSAAIGSVAEVIKTLPHVPDIEFENHIRCTEITYDGAFVHGVPYSNKRYLVGSVPSNRGIFGVRGDLPNPGLLLAQHFTGVLRESNIIVSQEADYITESQYPTRKVLYEHQSEPLTELLKEVNQESNNLYAEQIFRYLGHKLGLPCTINNSILIEKQCWKNRGINLQQTFIMDGCGLAPQDAVSAATFVQILSYMYKSRNYNAFLQTLPTAGENGTLRGFCRDTPLQSNVQAKSGTTSRIKSYAGYFTLPNGDKAAFAILVNNANAKSKVVQRMIAQLLQDVYQTNK